MFDEYRPVVRQTAVIIRPVVVYASSAPSVRLPCTLREHQHMQRRGPHRQQQYQQQHEQHPSSSPVYLRIRVRRRSAMVIAALRHGSVASVRRLMAPRARQSAVEPRSAGSNRGTAPAAAAEFGRQSKPERTINSSLARAPDRQSKNSPNAPHSRLRRECWCST